MKARPFGLRRRRSGAKRFTLFLVFALACAVVIALMSDIRLRPIVRSMAENQAKNLALTTIDSAVTDVLSHDNTDYDKLVSINLGSDGEINSIQSNTVEINRLKSTLSTAIANAIDGCDKKKLSIPIGTVLGGDLLSGRGPRINVYITISGSATVQISNSFESSGINQTRHQIILDVTARVYIIMTGGNVSTVLDTNFVIAETVIVGTVPELYMKSQPAQTPEATEKTAG